MSAKILVVDDSRTIRQQVKSVLTPGGYHVLEAEDGVQGLSVLAAHQDVAMVICDVNMPTMDGLEMLVQLKADPRTAALPVFMLTTEGGADLIQRAKQAGAKGWIVKPFKVDQLLAVVRKTVAQQARAAEAPARPAPAPAPASMIPRAEGRRNEDGSMS